ncbi:kinase-like protein [Sistotremastrum suecicum HHB10207 ss-3]|uniref:Kinase-like protein n=1 Tax=Sistotremastrum suecicum HHB10207 ss-3 TaxID=1314776 RepID=A0A166H8Q3_9AGAM|nr:kinase-like protein [Sistotremastrum suecicum HHB10207 ss-3]
MDVVPKGRPTGLRRVRDSRDLRPYINTQPAGRRADPNNPTNFLSPLLSLTTHIQSTYSLCNPQFKYESSHNPRRVLTKPSKPAHNDGYDNEDYDYILYVNDWLGTDEGHKYLILDILGQGTFGQVVKCQNMKTHEVVAVKVVKNKPAYYNQSLMEVTILQLLNNQHDPRDEHHILRMRDHFVHKSHLCLVFELLSQNLYELIKQNQFQGLSTQLVKVFTSQLLDALSVLKSARLIHCDLKPENILLKSLSTPGIKVIDFGSACHEKQTVYTYIQSRFYRSPEVLLGVSYSAAIDMWSLGCIAVELFLGLPLFPGTSEYNQITRIVEMLGLPPAHMLEHGKQTSQFFDSYIDGYGQKQYKLKSIEQYSREHNVQEQPGKQYFKANTLPEIINMAPMPPSRSSSSQARPSSTEIEREANNRAAFTDFCLGLLNLNPMERWTPQQARNHPFITGEKFVKRFQVLPPPAPALTLSSSSSADAKRPYGGLVQSQPKGSRAYQDAAAYNHQLNQHQAYTAQAQAAQAASNAFRNPYIAQVSAPQQSANSYPARDDRDGYSATQQQTQQPVQQYNQSTLHTQNAQPSGTSSIDHRLSQSTSGSLNNALSYSTSTSSQHGLQQSANPNPPSSSYYPNARARANTINQMDVIPPALMRLQQMGMDLSGVGRNALTPVMNRDDAVKEWERRAQGKAQPAQPYPQLEYLQQQAELASSGGWSQGNAAAPSRYPPPPTLQQYQTPVQLLVDNHDRRRDSTRAQRSDYLPTAMPAPPQASYTGSEAGHNSVYAPIQSNQYGLSSSRTHAQSFYPPGVVAAGQSHQSYGTDQSGSQNASSSRDSGVSGSMDWRA